MYTHIHSEAVSPQTFRIRAFEQPRALLPCHSLLIHSGNLDFPWPDGDWSKSQTVVSMQGLRLMFGNLKSHLKVQWGWKWPVFQITRILTAKHKHDGWHGICLLETEAQARVQWLPSSQAMRLMSGIWLQSLGNQWQLKYFHPDEMQVAQAPQ